MSRHQSSSGDTSKNHKYLGNVPENELIRAKIVRGPVIKAGWGHTWIQIIQDGVVTWDSRHKLLK